MAPAPLYSEVYSSGNAAALRSHSLTHTEAGVIVGHAELGEWKRSRAGFYVDWFDLWRHWAMGCNVVAPLLRASLPMSTSKSALQKVSFTLFLCSHVTYWTLRGHEHTKVPLQSLHRILGAAGAYVYPSGMSDSRTLCELDWPP
jgi:hypothetical protein